MTYKNAMYLLICDMGRGRFLGLGGDACKKSFSNFLFLCILLVIFGVIMSKIFCFLLAAAALSGCYQVHSDDDLRAVPVTNNPNIVPQSNGMGRFIAMP